MLNTQGPIGQADCHLVTLPDGRNVLIDAGEAGDAPGAVLAQLRRHAVRHLALAIISHFHRDHYGQLEAILDAGIAIDHVVVNVPQRVIADRELPWGCDYDDVLRTLAILQQRGVPYTFARAGDRLIEARDPDGVIAGIDVLCAYDGVNTPIGETDVNDTSIVLRLVHGTTCVLFTGDLNYRLGAHLAASGADIRADVLKAPHHGTEGCAPNAFFDRVGAHAVLVPSPTSLWLSQRSARIRTYFDDAGAAAWVNGLHGNVTVDLSDGAYRIQGEFGRPAAEVVLRPSIVLPPVPAEVDLGSRVILAATATGHPFPEYQWFKDGEPIPGATARTLTLAEAQAEDRGAYRVRASNVHGSVASDPVHLSVRDIPAVPRTAVLSNLSARGWSGPGDAVLIAGFVVGGQGAKSLLIRAVGPTLDRLGVTDAMQDPKLVLVASGGRPIGENETWSAGPDRESIELAAARVGAFALPVGSADAAMLITVPPGAYTVLATTDGQPGIVLAELYDMDPGSSATLINLSARSFVGEGDAALIAGFVCDGIGSIRLLCRGVGPSLQRFGLDGFLPVPVVRLHQASESLPLDRFTSAAVAQGDLDPISAGVGAFPLLPQSGDAASVFSFAPGVRTLVVSPGDSRSGIALVELYRASP